MHMGTVTVTYGNASLVELSVAPADAHVHDIYTSRTSFIYMPSKFPLL